MASLEVLVIPPFSSCCTFYDASVRNSFLHSSKKLYQLDWEAVLLLLLPLPKTLPKPNLHGLSGKLFFCPKIVNLFLPLPAPLFLYSIGLEAVKPG